LSVVDHSIRLPPHPPALTFRKVMSAGRLEQAVCAAGATGGYGCELTVAVVNVAALTCLVDKLRDLIQIVSVVEVSTITDILPGESSIVDGVKELFVDHSISELPHPAAATAEKIKVTGVSEQTVCGAGAAGVSGCE
jgi:hypothetical protein